MTRALLLAAAVLMQSVAADLREAVWNAVQPALPFPAATEQHVPIDGNTTARWIVRRAGADEGPLVAEVIANPLNRETQARAVQDMAAIQQEVVAAERRAQIEFERAREIARQSGAPVPVEGVTLDDEGVSGDRADAEERMTIEVASSRGPHVAPIDAATAPQVSHDVRGATWIVRVPARELPRDGQSRAQYHPAQAMLYFGSAKPAISETAERVYRVRAVGDEVRVVVLRGNSELIEQVIARANWSQLAGAAAGAEAPPLPEASVSR